MTLTGRFYRVRAREKGVDVTWRLYQEDEIIVEAKSPKIAARIVYQNSRGLFTKNDVKLIIQQTCWDSDKRDWDYVDRPSRFYAWDGDKVIKSGAFEYYNAKNLVLLH